MSYQEPSPILKRLFLPPKNPSLLLSSDQEWLVICNEPPLPSIQDLAKPGEEKLAGLRFDSQLLTPSRQEYATSLTIQHLSSGKQHEVELPADSAGIRYIRFHPSKPIFVFASKNILTPSLDLYKCELENPKDDSSLSKWKLEQVPLHGRRMNFINGCAFQYTSDGSSLLVKVVPKTWPSDAPKEPLSTGPAIQTVKKDARKAPGRTYQDLLRNKHDEDKLRFFLSTELIRIDVTSSLEIQPVSQSNHGFMIQSIQSSPCGRFLLAQIITKFSYSVPLRRFGKDVKIWDLETDQTIDVVSLPVDDEIPLSYDACSRDPRLVHFHPCHDHTVIHVQALDGGDPENDPVNGERDCIYMQNITKSESTEEWTLEENKTKLIGLEWRYNDIEFCENGMALVDSYRWKDRLERLWKLDINGSKTLLWERSWEDRYSSPGTPLTRRGTRGQYFLVQPTPTSFYLVSLIN